MAGRDCDTPSYLEAFEEHFGPLLSETLKEALLVIHADANVQHLVEKMMEWSQSVGWDDAVTENGEWWRHQFIPSLRKAGIEETTIEKIKRVALESEIK
jgi:hypothetical protein